MIKRRLIILLILFQVSNTFASDYSELDALISNSISNNYFPGAQILIGNENDILYSKSYGNFTYDESSPPVTEESIFDIASLTKVVATTSAIMLLYQQHKIDLNDKVSKYIPEFANNGKENITILNLLLHNSGLKAFIAFYKFYNNKEEVLNAIYNIDLDYHPDSKFLYSDLNAILLGIIVERVSGMSLDKYCFENIFYPLRMELTSFLPDEKMQENILPTENDTYWRNRLLKGEVHDESAAMMDGVAGNAGLFSNAKDLYLLMRVLLNEGKYYNPYSRGLKEEILFEPGVIDLFTTRFTEVFYSNSRALGWDTKPNIQSSKYRMPCGEVISDNCFGHTGYTGTSIWCDKDRKLIIIFLTNRVYPTRNNEGIREVRPDIHNTAIRIAANTN
ncbi:MAG TPA: serine hydrolase [Ignavibacteria bacterium]|nr:serine hydrolase [Ignavibacteria bacterium]